MLAVRNGVVTKLIVVAGLTVLLARPTAGHIVKHGDAVINYEDLLGGSDGKTPCCDQSHCQPASAWWHDEQNHVWKFTVKWGTGRANSEDVNANAEVEVPDGDVTYEDVQHKGLAHWCGEFVGGENQYYTNRCAFVPLKFSLGPQTPVSLGSSADAAENNLPIGGYAGV